MAISKKVVERITTQMKKYQAVLTEAKDRDISESDTVVIVADILADLLGYKKYIEITTEYAIRSTYVDLAVKVGNTVRFLLEVKAVGVSLKDPHIKQAVDYGANQGVEWVILTNGITWQVYSLQFRQPIDRTLILEFDLLKATPKNMQVMDCLGNLSREGFTQSSMATFCHAQQATSRFSLAALMLSAPILQTLRKELKRLCPNIKVDEDFLLMTLRGEVLKREVVDSDDAKQAAVFIKRAQKAVAKPKVKTEPTAKPADVDNDKILPMVKNVTGG